MKLRFHDGSLRLRLSQSEIARLNDTGKVEETIVFAPGKQLIYAIETGVDPNVTATFDNANIRVTLPSAVAREWTESGRTSIEASTPTLKLLIEKDFQCLHNPSGPEDDAFPNPLANKS